MISKVLSSHILQGNFATEKVTSLDVEANSVEPSVFLLQRNKLLIDHEIINKVKATSKNVMDFADSHKTKGKTAIACIGTMISMVDFLSLCISMDTIITPICSNDEPRPILCKLLLQFVAIVNNPDGSNPSAKCLSFIGTVTVTSNASSIALLILQPTP